MGPSFDNNTIFAAIFFYTGCAEGERSMLTYAEVKRVKRCCVRCFMQSRVEMSKNRGGVVIFVFC
jgi:uncharacterized membrane protein